MKMVACFYYYTCLSTYDSIPRGPFAWFITTAFIGDVLSDHHLPIYTPKPSAKVVILGLSAGLYITYGKFPSNPKSPAYLKNLENSYFRFWSSLNP